MLTTRATSDATVNLVCTDTEALIREARARRRRRWARGALIGLVLFSGAAAVAVLTVTGTRPPSAPAAGTAGVLPNGPLATLRVAGPLAVAPDGALYVTDVVGPGFESGGDRVLVRLPGGRFRVIAGDGKVGFSGDGGPAVDAELSSVSDLVFAPDGTLYIADGGRVRTVSPDGVIRTIVGDGQPRRTIVDGTPALSAALGSGKPNPLKIALSPAGQLYIATGYSQILRLTSTGTLDTVRAIGTSGWPWKGPVGGWGAIAVDKRDNIDVSCGRTGWSIWQIAPDGIAHEVGSGRAAFARGSGGTCPVLQPGPGDAIYTARPGISRLEPHKLVPSAVFNAAITPTINGQYFPPTYFAFSPNDTLYVDDLPGNSGFERHQQLRSTSNGHVDLLWQENDRTTK